MGRGRGEPQLQENSSTFGSGNGRGRGRGRGSLTQNISQYPTQSGLSVRPTLDSYQHSNRQQQQQQQQHVPSTSPGSYRPPLTVHENSHVQQYQNLSQKSQSGLLVRPTLDSYQYSNQQPQLHHHHQQQQQQYQQKQQQILQLSQALTPQAKTQINQSKNTLTEPISSGKRLSIFFFPLNDFTEILLKIGKISPLIEHSMDNSSKVICDYEEKFEGRNEMQIKKEQESKDNSTEDNILSEHLNDVYRKKEEEIELSNLPENYIWKNSVTRWETPEDGKVILSPNHAFLFFFPILEFQIDRKKR